MATKKSAMKRQRQNLKSRARNKHFRGVMKDSIKNLLEAVENKDKNKAKELLKTAISVIDKVKAKGVIHKGNASRKVSRLSTKVNSL